MISDEKRKEIISKGKPFPSDVLWFGELNLGSIYGEEEIEAVVNAIKQSSHWSTGFGPRSNIIKEFEEELANYCGTKFAIALTNGGAALDLSLRYMNLEKDDEIIIPAVNFKAAHMAALNYGAKVVFCDIDPLTLNFSVQDVERKISNNTRAIIPVYLTGLPGQIHELEKICKNKPNPKHGPPKIIVDAARAMGASIFDTKVGKDGWATSFSFHTQKLMTTLGEGGALTTDDEKLYNSVRNMCIYGGETSWGLNYRMNKIQAAAGLVQLKKIDKFIELRRKIAHMRHKLLEGIDEITVPFEPEGYNHAYYVYPILFKSEWGGEKRNKFLKIMEDKFGIICSITNLPVYERWPYIVEKCGIPSLPVSDEVTARLFCPPIHPELNDEQELYIVSSIIESILLLREY